MIHDTCRLTAKNRDQLRNPTLGNRVWAAFYFFNVNDSFHGLQKTWNVRRRRPYRLWMKSTHRSASSARFSVASSSSSPSSRSRRRSTTSATCSGPPDPTSTVCRRPTVRLQRLPMTGMRWRHVITGCCWISPCRGKAPPMDSSAEAGHPFS